MTRAQALRRIRACLRLGASSEPHEAAAALRQAQALMREHGVSEAEAELAEVQTATRPMGRARTPPAYLVQCANMVASAMGARIIYDPMRLRSGGFAGRVVFVGCGPRAEIAAYAYVVLGRQLADGRAECLRRNRRLKRASRTRRADLWCQAWVEGAARHVQALALPSREQDLVERYMAGKDLTTRTGRESLPKARDVATWLDGFAHGNAARLHHGVGARSRPTALPAVTGE